MEKQTVDNEYMASMCFTGNNESYDCVCDQINIQTANISRTGPSGEQEMVHIASDT
jgi:hypothetical protein